MDKQSFNFTNKIIIQINIKGLLIVVIDNPMTMYYKTPRICFNITNHSILTNVKEFLFSLVI